MRLPCTTILAIHLLFASASHAADNAPTRYLQLVNRANDSVVALALAPVGDEAFQPIMLDRALRGGGDSTTLQVASSSCHHDLRLQFDNGRKVLYRNVNLCRQGGVRIGRLPRLDESTEAMLGAR